MICQFCFQENKLIRAHIIPRCFYDAVKAGDDHTVVVNTGRTKFTEVSQSGIFDSQILCAACDAKLGKLDEYGFSKFGKSPGEENIFYDQQGYPLGYRLDDLDVDRAKRFLLSVLWRADLTDHFFFSLVKLGPYRERIREVLLNERCGGTEDWSIVVIRYFDQKYDGALYPPWSFRLDEGIRIYAVFLPFFKILIKIDKMPLPEPFLTFSLKSPEPFCIRLPFEGTPEARYLVRMTAQLRKLSPKGLTRR